MDKLQTIENLQPILGHLICTYSYIYCRYDMFYINKI